jgi:hypothetical protein
MRKVEDSWISVGQAHTLRLSPNKDSHQGQETQREDPACIWEDGARDNPKRRHSMEPNPPAHISKQIEGATTFLG